MSLRDSLKAVVGARVARCTPLPMQRATLSTAGATGGATDMQQADLDTSETWGFHGATADATQVQRGSCTAPATERSDATGKLGGETLREAELHVACTTPCNTQLGMFAQRRLAIALTAAINRTCNARGDDDHNRAALLHECAQLAPEGQADMLGHFTIEAARWEAACKGIAP
jgi:hypothetical protein